MKLCFIALILFFISISENYCQSNKSSFFSFGGGVALPSKDSIKSGYNVFANYEWMINRNLAVRSELNFYNNNIDKKIEFILLNKKYSYSFEGFIWDFSLGAEVLAGDMELTKNVSLYGLLGFGVNIWGQKAEINDDHGNQIDRASTGEAEFNTAITIGAGLQYRFSSQFGLVLEVKYAAIEKHAYIPIRVGFIF